ncbi:hypothetical protein R3P38DRAFT_3193059 [Favolaschia claudopus]|uniref:Repressor of RNA polymerase III transcription MAF1 homolog n=1 Tax=Favolaschia claudopus TaxID=2862362 RepID=A0AAW0BIS9_9AGAR
MRDTDDNEIEGEAINMSGLLQIMTEFSADMDNPFPLLEDSAANSFAAFDTGVSRIRQAIRWLRLCVRGNSRVRHVAEVIRGGDSGYPEYIYAVDLRRVTIPYFSDSTYTNFEDFLCFVHHCVAREAAYEAAGCAALAFQPDVVHFSHDSWHRTSSNESDEDCEEDLPELVDADMTWDSDEDDIPELVDIYTN